MSLPASQDPAGAFDYSTVAQVHDQAYDTLAGTLLSVGWFLPLAAAIVVLVVRRIDPNKVREKWAKRLFWAAGLLLLGPIAVSYALHGVGGTPASLPNFAGLAEGAKASDTSAEMIGWAHQRYGVGLNTTQAGELQKLTNKGFMVTSNETHPVIFNGGLIHGTAAAGQVILVDADGKELPVHHG